MGCAGQGLKVIENMMGDMIECQTVELEYFI